MGVSSFLDKWLGRIATAWTFFGPIVPGTAAAIIVGFASSGVAWISQFGLFGALASAIVTFLLVSAGYALMARARLWGLEAANRQRIASGSSPFDPMEMVFQKKRIHISDLVNPYNQVIIGKKFIDCELIGPANIILMVGSWKFAGNNLDLCDAVEISNTVTPQNAILFADCDFERCRFFKVTLLFQRKAKDAANNLIKDMNWITNEDVEEVAGLLQAPKSSSLWPWKRRR